MRAARVVSFTNASDQRCARLILRESRVSLGNGKNCPLRRRFKTEAMHSGRILRLFPGRSLPLWFGCRWAVFQPCLGLERVKQTQREKPSLGAFHNSRWRNLVWQLFFAAIVRILADGSPLDGGDPISSPSRSSANMHHRPHLFRPTIRFVFWVVVVAAGLCGMRSEADGQTSFLEARYEFNSDVDPPSDSTGNNGDAGLLNNFEDDIDPRLGEESLIGDDGFSIGFDAPGDNHPTGHFLLVEDFPHPDSFSASLWIRPQLTGADEALLARDNVWWPSPCNFYCLYIDPQQSLVWKTGGEETVLTDEFVVEEDEIHHVVITHADTDGPDTGKADRSRIYVDGELVGEEDDPPEIPSLDAIADDNGIFSQLFIGTLSSFGGFSGEMDDFQFYSAELTSEQVAQMHARPGSLADFGEINGDYNDDGSVDVLDIDLQAGAMKSADPDLVTFDENGDGSVDYNDRLIWVKQHAGTWVGDANLDNEFNSGDLVSVFAAGKYETAEMAGWGEGDWNGDMSFDSS